MTGREKPKMSSFLFLISFVFLFLHVHANECSIGCDADKKVAGGYTSDDAYLYDYSGATSIHLSGADNQETQAKISAKVLVSKRPNCNNILQIKSIQITGPDGKQYDAPAGIHKPVKFTLEDLAIKAILCAEDGDSQMSLNIKRSILSTLQMSSEETLEIDIFGLCPTTFTVSGNRVSKTKDLNACENNDYDGQNLLHHIYNPNSAFNSANIVEAKLKVESTVDHGYVTHYDAKEEYFYKPFSVGNSGAKATVLTTMEFVKFTKDQVEENCVHQKSTTYEKPLMADKNTINDIENALTTATKYLEGHVQEKSAGFFTALIKVMRGSSKDNIHKVYTQIEGNQAHPDKVLTKKVFLDALFRTGTGASMEVSMQLLRNNELTPLQKRLVFSSFANARQVSTESLKSIAGLMNVADIPNELYLGMGALVAVYCHNQACQYNGASTDSDIADISASMVAKLANCKAHNREQENMMIAVLKGIKNMNHIQDNAINAVVECAKNKEVMPRVRLAAIEALAADACNEKVNSAAYTILEDESEDSELRIKAYLSLLVCPTDSLVKSVRNILHSEKPIYQVCSFITSSLKNIQQSSSASARRAQELFKNFPFVKTYPLDPRRFSQAYETNYEAETFDIETALGTNIIYSQNSFLPRSVSLNLTADIFGNSVNLLELGVRQSNLERVLEEYFGPQGLFRTTPPQKMYDDLKQAANGVHEKIQNRMKGHKTKRDVQHEIAALAEKLKADKAGYHGNMDIDVFVKLFGSESIFLSLGDDHHFTMESLIDRIFDVVEGSIDGAQKFSHEVRSHTLFLDSEMIYPTLSGLPLVISTQGASTGKLNFGGNLDIRQIFGDMLNSKFNIDLIPSANVEITTSIAVDAQVFSTGLKVTSTMQTSTGVQLTAKLLNNGQGFDINVGLPLEEQQVISVTNDVTYFYEANEIFIFNKPLEFKSKLMTPTPPCKDDYVKSLGMSLCTTREYPENFMNETAKDTGEPRFPFNGQLTYKMVAKKVDLESFRFYGMSGFQGANNFWELTFDAPGASYSRKSTGRLEIGEGKESYSLSAKLDSPTKKLHASVSVSYSNQDKSLTLNMVDNEDIYNAKAGIMLIDLKPRITLKPVLEVSAPQMDTIKLEGNIYADQIDHSTKFVYDKLRLHKGEQVVTFNGWYKEERKVVTWDFKLSEGEHSASTTGKLFDKPDGTNQIHVDFQNTIDPEWNFVYQQDMKMDKVSNPKTLNLSINLIHGPDPKSKTNLISLTSEATATTGEEASFTMKEQITYPLMDLDYNTNIEYVEDKRFSFIVEGTQMAEKSMVEIVFDDKYKSPKEAFGKFRFLSKGNGLESFGSWVDEDEENSVYRSHLELYPGGKYEISGSIKIHEESNDEDNMYIVRIQVPDRQLVTFESNFIDNSDGLKGHTKISTIDKTFFNVDYDLNSENPKGNVSFYVIELISLKCNFQFDGTAGDSMLNIDIHGVDEVVQLELNGTMNDDQYNVQFIAYTDYKRDKTQFYKIVSINTVTEDVGFTTSNSLFWEEKEAKLKVKYEKTGELTDNKMSLDVDFVDPSGHAYKTLYNEHKLYDFDVVNEDYELLLQKTDGKTGKLRKLTMMGKLKDFDSPDYTGTVTLKTIFLEENGHDVIFTFNHTKKRESLRSEVEVMTGLSGALVSTEWNYQLWTEYYDYANDEDQFDINYKLKGNYGSDTSFDAKGRYAMDVDEEKMYSNNIDLTIRLPSEKLRTIVLSSKASYNESSDYAYVQSSSITAHTKFVVNSDSYVYNLDYAGSSEGVYSGNFAVELPDRQPFAIQVNEKHTIDDSGDKRDMVLDVVLDSHGKVLKYTLTGSSDYPKATHGEYKSTLTLPYNKGTRTIKSNYIYTFETNSKFSTSVDVEIDGKKYFTAVNFDYDRDGASLLDLKYSYPYSEPKRIYFKLMKLPDRKYQGHVTFEKLGDFNFDLILSGDFKSEETFKVKGHVNCANLDLNDVDFTASGLAQKSDVAKAIQFEAKEKGKPFITGKMQYHFSTTDKGVTLASDGKFDVRGVSKEVHLKYASEEIRHPRNIPFYVLFGATIGDKSFTFEHKDSEWVYKLASEYCESANDCARIHVNSVIEKGSHPNTNYNETLEIKWDLKKLGFPDRFSLMSEFHTDAEKLPNNLFDMEIERSDNIYKIKSHSAQVDEKYKTYLAVTIPTRVMTFETTSMYHSSETDEAYLAESIIYLNKNDPKSKVHFRTAFDMKLNDSNPYTVEGDVFFVYPGAKESKMTIKSQINGELDGNLVSEIDIFDTKEKMILIEGSIKPAINGDDSKHVVNFKVDGKAHNFEYTGFEEITLVGSTSLKVEGRSVLKVEEDKLEETFLITINPQSQKINVQTPVGCVIDMENIVSEDIDTGYTKCNLKLVLFEDMKYSADASFNTDDGLTFKINADLGKPSEIVSLHGSFNPNGNMEISSMHNNYSLAKMTYIVPKDGGEPVSINESNEKHMKMYLDSLHLAAGEIEKRSEEFEKKYVEIWNKAESKLMENLKKSIPENGLCNYMVKELKAVHEEIKADDFLVLLEIQAQAVVKLTYVLLDNLYVVYTKTDQLADMFVNAFLESSFNLYPMLAKSYGRALEVSANAAEPLVDLYLDFVSFVSNTLERHTPHFIQIGESLAQFYRSVMKAADEVEEFISKFTVDLFNVLVVVPVDETLQLLSSENLHKLLDYIGEVFEDILPKDEWKDLYNAIVRSQEKGKVNHSPEVTKERFDDVRNKTENLVLAMLNSIDDELGLEEDWDWDWDWDFLFDDDDSSNSSAVKTYKKAEPLVDRALDDDSTDIFRAIRPVFHPEDTFRPYKLRGYTSGGRHIFTFDERYLRFPGNCEFVLAQDAVDGNFTIVMDIKNNKTKSITLVDKHGYTLQVNNEGKLMANGQENTYPVRTADLDVAVKRINMFVLKTKYGASIECTEDLSVCSFKVSGYYYGKLRGLLGDGNNEPFDDYRLPNGTVTSSDYNFGVSYALNAGCASENAEVEYSEFTAYKYIGMSAAIDYCTDLFEGESELADGNLVVDREIYMHACKREAREVSSPEEAQAGACMLAKTYSQACMGYLFPVQVPQECIECNFNRGTVKASDETEILVNQSKKQADIILVVETTKTNEKVYTDMVAPLMTEVLKELKAKEIDDVKVYLVGLNPIDYSSTLYESNINNFNLASKIHFTDEERSEKWKPSVHTNDINVDEYTKMLSTRLEWLRETFGFLDTKLFTLGRDVVQFRPTVMKSVILVQSKICPAGFLADMEKDEAMDALKSEGVQTHLITRLEDFDVQDIKEPRSTFGFNTKEVFIDGEKKWKRDDAFLNYRDDPCINIALETNGNVYSSKQFEKMDSKRHTNVLKQIAQSIVNSMTAATTSEMECTCKGGITGLTSKMSCAIKE